MNELFSYTTTVFESDDVSNDFKISYEKIWKIDHPKLDDFVIEFEELEGREVIEVIQNNPMFPLTALFEIFRQESDKTRVLRPVEDKEFN